MLRDSSLWVLPEIQTQMATIHAHNSVRSSSDQTDSIVPPALILFMYVPSVLPVSSTIVIVITRRISGAKITVHGLNTGVIESNPARRLQVHCNRSDEDENTSQARAQWNRNVWAKLSRIPAVVARTDLNRAAVSAPTSTRSYKTQIAVRAVRALLYVRMANEIHKNTHKKGGGGHKAGKRTIVHSIASSSRHIHSHDANSVHANRKSMPAKA